MAEELGLEAELTALIGVFDTAAVPYAVCGALALAIHGHPRATRNIDLMVPASSMNAAKAVAYACGFVLESLPTRFSQRISKLVGRNLLMLDILTVTETLEPVWDARIELSWRDRRLWSVSRQGLVSMKLAAGRPQDLADIERLEESS